MIWQLAGLWTLIVLAVTFAAFLFTEEDSDE
jgi:hypothetical protein